MLGCVGTVSFGWWRCEAQKCQRIYPGPQATVSAAGSRSISIISEKKETTHICDELEDTCDVVFCKMIDPKILDL